MIRTAPKHVAARGDRHRDVEQRSCRASASARIPSTRLSAQRGRDLRARANPLARRRRVRVGDAAPAPVDDHDPAAGVDAGSAAASVCSAGEALPDCSASSASDAARTRRARPSPSGPPLGAGVHDPERHLERHQHDERQREIAREQPPAHARRRRPMPRTVSISPGRRACGAARRRGRRSVFDEPYQVVFQTSRRMRSRSTTAPASRASSASRSNSFAVSCTSRPSTRGAVRAQVDAQPTCDELVAPPRAGRRCGASRRGCARSARAGRTA